MKPPSPQPTTLGEAAEGTTVKLRSGEVVMLTGRYPQVCWGRQLVIENGIQRWTEVGPYAAGTPLAAGGQV